MYESRRLALARTSSASCVSGDMANAMRPDQDLLGQKNGGGFLELEGLYPYIAEIKAQVIPSDP